MNSGFADRGLTTWLPRRILLLEPIRWLPPFLFYLPKPVVANFREPSERQPISGRQLRIIPYNGNRAYKYYLDGYKVNGKRSGSFSRTKVPPIGNIGIRMYLPLTPYLLEIRECCK